MATEKPLVQFIVNADDLGGTDAINSAIFAAISDGLITSATIMATGPAFDDACRRTREFGTASFGVHMNLTAHRPLTGSARLAPLLDDNGEFRRNGPYEVQWTKELVSAVADEWTAQVAQVRRAGVNVSHIDSHHHTHTRPGLFRALKIVQRNTGVRRVRTTWSIYDRESAPSRKLRVMKRLWRTALRSVYSTRTTDEFCDFLMFLRAVSEGSYAPTTWPRVVELMVHPTGDPASDGEEAQALREKWLHSLPVRGRLVSYAQL